jgi:glycyl-tRNA synthetase
MSETLMEKIISLSKRRGFIYQGSEIYGGLAGTWDYGPMGVELKNNIKKLWWKMFVQERPDVYGVDAAILMNPEAWRASGHVEGFADPLVEDLETHERFRADHLLEENRINPLGMTFEQMDEVIKEKSIKSPKGNGLSPVQKFNMMFATKVGASEDSSAETYLRPETAGGIFVNFKNVVNTLHPKLPFGIAQIGKAFRNEIAPRDFIFRTREFEQLELEYFVKEDEWKESFEDWRIQVNEWLKAVGINTDDVVEQEIEAGDLAHYSKRTIDFEYKYPFGQKELYGLAYRTDFDLSAHQKQSGESLEYFDQESGEKFLPHVIEPSFGLDRTILAVLLSAYAEEEVEGETRVVLKFPASIAPVQVAILPLMKKDGLAEKGKEIFDLLKKNFVCQYDETGSIGKRYRRQDEIGTPFCITVDHTTLENETVTIRHRDTMAQDRVRIETLQDYLNDEMK